MLKYVLRAIIALSIGALVFVIGSSLTSADTILTNPVTIMFLGSNSQPSPVSSSAPLPVTNPSAPPLGSASGGWTPVGKTAITNSAVTVKASAGQLGLAVCDNNNNAWTYIQLFDASSPSLGTNVGFIPLPPNLTSGYSISLVGLQFSNSIKVAATTTPGGSSAPATNTINCTFGYN